MSKKLNISFDFDGTLFYDYDGVNVRQDIVDFAKDLVVSDIHNIFIITRRYAKGGEETDVYLLAEKIGVKKENVKFCNRAYKWENINLFNIDIHIDDDLEDLYRIKEQTKCLGVDAMKKNVIKEFQKVINELEQKD